MKFLVKFKTRVRGLRASCGRRDGQILKSEGFLYFPLVLPADKIVDPSAETWPSGRRRSPAKGVGPEGSRGFESLRLRHHILPISVPVISGTIPAQFQGFTTVLCD